MRKIIILVISGVYVLLLISCNAKIDLQLHKNVSVNANTDGAIKSTKQQKVLSDISVNIALKEYLMLYLHDLLGVSSIDELIEYIDIEKYFESKTSISQIQIKGTKDTTQRTSSINITFYSDDIFATLDEFNIPYEIANKKDYNELNIIVSREFLSIFLESFQTIKDLGLVDSFFPDKKVISKKQFPRHIAWAFSDYNEKNEIKKDLKQSEIVFSMKKKNKQFPSKKDAGWKQSKEDKDIKTRHFDLTSIIYSEEQALHIVF